MGGESSTYGGEETCVQGLVQKPKEKRPLVRPRRKWKNNIKINLQEMEWDVKEFDIARNKNMWRNLVKAALNLLLA